MLQPIVVDLGNPGILCLAKHMGDVMADKTLTRMDLSEVPINPRRVLTFRPSHLMKDRVADGNKR